MFIPKHEIVQLLIILAVTFPVGDRAKGIRYLGDLSRMAMQSMPRTMPLHN